jgi:cytochrome c553
MATAVVVVDSSSSSCLLCHHRVRTKDKRLLRLQGIPAPWQHTVQESENLAGRAQNNRLERQRIVKLCQTCHNRHSHPDGPRGEWLLQDVTVVS